MNSYGLSFYNATISLVVIHFFSYECHPKYYQFITPRLYGVIWLAKTTQTPR